jgi:hypothetical protein
MQALASLPEQDGHDVRRLPGRARGADGYVTQPDAKCDHRGRTHRPPGRQQLMTTFEIGEADFLLDSQPFRVRSALGRMEA